MAVDTLSREERIKTIHDAFMALMWIAKRHFAHRLQTFGLTLPQFMALATLVAHRQPCTMSDLITVTFQDAPTMTGVIDRLVKMKLVERTRSEVDRRVVLVQAAPAGVDLVNQIENEILCDDFSSYASLTDEDLLAMEQLIRHILRAHLGRYTSLQESDLDAEIEKLRRFKRDPIHYAQLETHLNGKQPG